MAKDNKQFVTELTNREEDYSQWYIDLVRKTELADYTCVKGCMVIRPYGYALWENVRDPLDLKRYMSMVIVALLPALAMSVYYFGIRVLAMTMVAYAAGGAVEVIFAFIRKEEINEGFLVTGLIFPLIMPPTVPLWMVALVSSLQQ